MSNDRGDDDAARAAWVDQAPHDVRVEWGPHGLRALAPVVDVLVIVDVLSFTTSVTVAVEAGAEVLPYRWDDGGEADYATARDAVLAHPARDLGRISLSPSSLRAVEPGTRLVLPSANGSVLSFSARDDHAVATVLAASLRNAGAVARHAARLGGTIGVLAAGERWRGRTGPMRVALEDLLGVGAVVAALPDERTRSGEADAAAAAFRAAEDVLAARIGDTASGRELIQRGFAADVAIATEVDSSTVVPVLVGDAYVDA